MTFQPFARKFGTFVPALLLALVSSLAPRIGEAADYISVESMEGKKLRIDGVVGEWPRGFDTLKTKSGSATKNATLLGYDQEHLYLAAKIKDPKLIRTRGGSKNEDHVSIDIYIPSPKGRGKSHHIDVFVGVPGKIAAMIHVDGRKIGAGKAIEAPTDDGFTLEAKIPWKALKSASSVRVGMRGKVSYFDARTAGRIHSVTSTSNKRGALMPPLALSAETGLIQSVLAPQGLSFSPAREVYADVTGKGGLERIALYGHFLTIVGPGYKGGKQFYVSELDVERASQVTRLSSIDIDGDGTSELWIEKQLGPKDNHRNVFQLLKIAPDGTPRQIFIHEIGIVTPTGTISNRVTKRGSGNKVQIEIAQGTANGFEPDTFREPSIGGGIPSALLPWQAVQSRSFGWKDGNIVLLNEKIDGSKTAKRRPVSSSPLVAAATAAPPPPRAPTQDELLDRVYALYKKDRGVSRRAKASFDFVTDVVEDDQMERVLVHGRDLVVFGKGFKKGLSYTYLVVGVNDNKDILSVTTRDLTGDGKAEILIHATVDTKTSKSLGGEIVSRQALFVYKIIGENLARIFSAETGRSLKGKRIISTVAFIAERGAISLELRGGRAIGWTEKNYPFPEDQHPAGGMEPLILPWGTLAKRQYFFDGSVYSQRN